ncbi:MAG: protein arginine kinase [candidate division KSB1 bacterium]|nr:protein arginine kinase [candidate division KSB1 bacterium]
MNYPNKENSPKNTVAYAETVSQLNRLVNQVAKWLDGSGPEANCIISSRIRLARNLSHFPFTNRANLDHLEQVLTKVKEALPAISILRNSLFVELSLLSPLDRNFLKERRLISLNLADQNYPAGLIMTPDEVISVMINEEDHLRLQVIQSGLEMTLAWKLISKLDDQMGHLLEYAYSDHFGYLTACPTNTGTGMRASIFIHLPALALTGEIDKIVKDLAPSEIAIRGFYGEGSEVWGNIFQISNQLTLGRTEEHILERLEFIAKKFLDLELQARENLMRHNKIVVEDKVYRAYAILEKARILSSSEFIGLMSALRLGIDTGLIQGISSKTLNELMVLVQPAHIQKLYKRKMDAHQRDILRAELVRQKLHL